MKPITKGGQILSNRRKKALKRLLDQAALGLKQPKGTFLAKEKVPLTEGDKTRINREIDLLRQRV